MDVKPQLYIRQSFTELLYAAWLETFAWLLIIVVAPLVISALDGALSEEDLLFALTLILPASSLAVTYVLTAGLTNNFNRLLQLHFGEATLEVRVGYAANQIPLQRVRHFRIEGLVFHTLYLYLNSSARPLKLSLCGLNRKHRRQLKRHLQLIVEENSSNTEALPPKFATESMG